MSISHYIKDIGRGRDGARALDRAKATDLMGQILDGHVSDLELGAFCIAMRIKGETDQEMAGFLDATHARLQHISASSPVVVLPSYNGARKLPVLTPLLAHLLAREGLAVVMHGTATESTRITSQEVLSAMGADAAVLSGEADMAKISISGAGILGRPGVAARLFDTLARLGINLRLIATSEVKVSCVVAGRAGPKALRATAEAFELQDRQLGHHTVSDQLAAPAVRGVALDRDQIQVTVRHVPDQPGSAAAVCRTLAEAAISLDAIVQSERTHTMGQQLSRDMSFVLKREDLSRAEDALAPLLLQWPEACVEEGSAIARVSAVGAGMPSTPGTAARMFRAIAEAGINIELIATSEIRTSCVVPERDGVRALQAVHAAFALGGVTEHQAEGTEAPLP